MTTKTAKAEAPAKVTEVDRNIPTDIAGKTYFMGEKEYNPRAVHNSYQWEIMVDLLTKAGAKGVKGAILATSLATHNSKPDQAHFNFISYLERRNSLRHKVAK